MRDTPLYRLRDPFSLLRVMRGRTTTQLHFEIDAMSVGTLHVPNEYAADIVDSFTDATPCGYITGGTIDWTDSRMKFYTKPVVIDDDGNVIDLSTLQE